MIDYLAHTCEWHFVPGSEEKYRPYPNAPYYKRRFQIECLRCRDKVSVACNSAADMAAKIATYPVLPVFPR